MTDQVMKFCPVCKRKTLHIQPGTMHLLHLVLSVLTLGCWLPFWFIASRNNATQSACTVCGRETGLFGTVKTS